MATDEPAHANDLIEAEIVSRLRRVENILDSDVMAFIGPILDTTPNLFKQVIEKLPSRRSKMTVWLETEGGYIEPAERIANILRHHYSVVDFMVTTYAMSAGTVLVMSGDNIVMDYSATLGPIDPQFRRPGSDSFVPALGYLEQYERLIEKSAAGVLTTAELTYLLQNFDAAELYQFEQARELSVALLEDWLAKYKFKNWSVTETTQTPVTTEMRKERAKEIALRLNETARWHSHARGISMEILRRDLNLRIDDLDESPKLKDAVVSFRRLLYDYRQKLGHFMFVYASSEEYHGH